MFYNEARTMMDFKAYRIPIRCWRCWKRHEFFAPYEFVDVLLFKCERCSAMKATRTYADYVEAAGKYVDLHYPHVPREDDEKYINNEFLPVFEDRWVMESCSCGGRFRLKAPIRCPYCKAPEWRLLRGSDEIVESPPIPVLQFTIPPEYANAPSRPPWQPKAKG